WIPRGAALIVLATLVAIAASMQARAQPTNDLDPFNEQIKALYDQGKYTDARDHQRTLAGEIEKSEIAGTGKAGRRTAGALGRFAWFALFTSDFDEALAAAEKAAALAPDLLWIELNRAHALLFIGRLDDAQALYVAHKGKEIPQYDNNI